MMISLQSQNVGDDAGAIITIQDAADSSAEVLQLNFFSEMKEIPASVKMLREHLEVLYLDNNYSLKVLPALLGDFPRLHSLDACYCHLQSASPALCRLRRLRQLYLSNNSFQFLPPEMSQLKGLEALRIDNNKLQVLPGGLVFLPALRELTVENNPLYTPEEVDGAEAVMLVPHQTSVDCANCCVRVRNYQVAISFHRLPCLAKTPLPFVFFLCSEECNGHLQHRLAQHDARMAAA